MINSIEVGMYIWAGKVKQTLPKWFVHQKTITLTPEMLQELYDTGVGIMLNDKTLFVDDRKFTVR